MKKITFFYSTPQEKQIFSPIAENAITKGFKINFTKNLKKKAQIGFYCQSKNFSENSKISIILLGGIDQGRGLWPNVWSEQPWNKFDLGFLPSKDWANKWKDSSWNYRSRTRYGVFESGWPKVDFLIDKKSVSKRINFLKKKYLFPKKGKNILYAPAFESHQKQLDVVRSVKKLNFNLLIKHWMHDRDINLINSQSKKELGKKVCIIDPKVNFIELLPFTDLLITDESSVAYEALLLNIPTISVSDWYIRRHKLAPSRLVKPSNVCFPTTRKNLFKKINLIIKNKELFKKRIEKKKNYYFSYLGESSSIIIQILIKFLKKDDICNSKYFIKPSYNLNYFRSFFQSNKILKKINNYYA